VQRNVYLLDLTKLSVAVDYIQWSDRMIVNNELHAASNSPWVSLPKSLLTHYSWSYWHTGVNSSPVKCLTCQQFSAIATVYPCHCNFWKLVCILSLTIQDITHCPLFKMSFSVRVYRLTCTQMSLDQVASCSIRLKSLAKPRHKLEDDINMEL